MCTTCASDARGQGTCTMPAPARSALCKDENRVYVVDGLRVDSKLHTFLGVVRSWSDGGLNSHRCELNIHRTEALRAIPSLPPPLPTTLVYALYESSVYIYIYILYIYPIPRPLHTYIHIYVQLHTISAVYVALCLYRAYIHS